MVIQFAASKELITLLGHLLKLTHLKGGREQELTQIFKDTPSADVIKVSMD